MGPYRNRFVRKTSLFERLFGILVPTILVVVPCLMLVIFGVFVYGAFHIDWVAQQVGHIGGETVKAFRDSYN